MRSVELYCGGYYHVYNRGVDKRNIFPTKSDYQRFLFTMDILNDANFQPNNSLSKLKIEPNVYKQPYVRIMCYCLMPNHHHLELEQLIDNGISLYMARLSNSYTKYFNIKYDRKGRLFESSFKAIEITNDDYLLHLTRYIHLNSLDLIEPRWKTNGISNWKNASRFLESFPWSSYQSYLKLKNDPVIDIGILKEVIKSPMAYKKFIQEWTEKSFNKLHPLAID
ncbi:MAG: transposase [Candidatus Uhrbacteria bacterium]|nr:transposase [Patescibacteria group bacterium]MBU1907044.1 transposase [Patescibacteria group bacterium]